MLPTSASSRFVARAPRAGGSVFRCCFPCWSTHCLLSLTFSGQEFGLPGFALPWQDRRIEVPDLRVVLAPAPVANPKPAITSDPLPLPPVLIEQTVAAGPAVVTFKSPGRRPARPAPATVPRNTPKAKASPRPKAATSKAPAVVSRSTAKAKANPRPKAATGKAPVVVPRSTPKVTANPKPKAATGKAPANALADLAPQPKSFPSVIALDQAKEAEFVVPRAPLEPAPAVSAAPRDAGAAAQAQIDQPARERVAEEAAWAESARIESERRETERQALARQELAVWKLHGQSLLGGKPNARRTHDKP